MRISPGQGCGPGVQQNYVDDLPALHPDPIDDVPYTLVQMQEASDEHDSFGQAHLSPREDDLEFAPFSGPVIVLRESALAVIDPDDVSPVVEYISLGENLVGEDDIAGVGGEGIPLRGGVNFPGWPRPQAVARRRFTARAMRI